MSGPLLAVTIIVCVLFICLTVLAVVNAIYANDTDDPDTDEGMGTTTGGF